MDAIAPPVTVTLPQHRETPLTTRRHGAFEYAFGYARAEESRASDDAGQDYVTVREDGARLVFVVCDGVGQSFFGELAARTLGDALRELLWELSAGQLDPDTLGNTLEHTLSALVEPSSAAVSDVRLPAELAPMLRTVLERKRQLGSESSFAAGVIDAPRREALFTWMGDVRIWHRNSTFDGAFLSRERWSTRRGLVGDLHVARTEIDDAFWVVVFSDGLPVNPTCGAQVMPSALCTTLGSVIARGGDDDASVFTVHVRND